MFDKRPLIQASTFFLVLPVMLEYTLGSVTLRTPAKVEVLVKEAMEGSSRQFKLRGRTGSRRSARIERHKRMRSSFPDRCLTAWHMNLSVLFTAVI
jgi:hypothetical protein